MNANNSFETLELRVDGPIAHLWLNRPERLNALSTQLLKELVVAARWLDDHEDVRVVVVGGRGRAFSGGADLAGFPSLDDLQLRDAADAGRCMAEALEAMRAVSIARIQGWCVGGGLVLAAACDLRVAVDSTRFSIPEVDLGIPLAWGGIERLVREIGPAMTKELVITCREFDAAEAQQVGFINRVVSDDLLDSTVDELAASIAAKPGMPVAATKRHTNAVTAQMVGAERAWSDADGLIAALVDPECAAVRKAYIETRLAK
ncbi:MAG: enoyl-CoA hydratase/isomerase family protein [Pseudomonadota bacterium]